METLDDKDLIPYAIGARTILITPDHSLPVFQQSHRLYDRFVPVLCTEIDSKDQYIIDVGANIGDSACAILQACSNPLVCIEGHDAYFKLLERNIAALPEAQRVKSVRAIVGTGQFSGALISDGTTASLGSGEDQQHAVRLDDILHGLNIPDDGICFMKLDTDGYDADVISSAKTLITGSEPLLFWENYFADENQFALLDDLYEILKAWRYEHLWIFDNFGNLILEDCSFKQARDLNLYLKSQAIEGNSRTMWYTDILGSTSKRLDVAQRAIAKFRRLIFKSDE